MRILWVCPTLLHPTINGSQIRTLGILRQLASRHEVDFVGLARRGQDASRGREYASRVFTYLHEPSKRRSVKFAVQAAANVFSSVPLNVARYRSAAALERTRTLMRETRYDAIVADFLLSAPNIPAIEDAVLFQHNVESRIMERAAATARSKPLRIYLQYLARRLETYEGRICKRVKHVITVSRTDSAYLQERFGVINTTPVPTGVDVEHYQRNSAQPEEGYDLLFVGSMDYIPNVEGVRWFLREVLPLIEQKRPGTTLGIVGKNPDASIHSLAENNPRVFLSGTVPDVRPYLWSSAVSIVPVFAGSGTRLKIYEAMAAGLPVVSTTVGAEGLTYKDGENIVIADTAETFAAVCVDLLDNPQRRQALAAAAHAMVAEQFDWSMVARQFEVVLESVRR